MSGQECEPLYNKGPTIVPGSRVSLQVAGRGFITHPALVGWLVKQNGEGGVIATESARDKVKNLENNVLKVSPHLASCFSFE